MALRRQQPPEAQENQDTSAKAVRVFEFGSTHLYIVDGPTQVNKRKIMKAFTLLTLAVLAITGCDRQGTEANSEANLETEIKMERWSVVDCGRRKPCIEGIVINQSDSTPAFIYARFSVLDNQNNQLVILEPR